MGDDERIENGEEPDDAEAQGWAKPVERLEVGGLPDEAVNKNVAGKRLTGALQGFGKLWQKTYTVQVGDIPPERVISEWKANYSSFWPPGDRLYTPFTDLKPGDVGVINSNQAGVTLSTGIMVIYSDDVSFAFMTPQGHPFAGWITFSAQEQESGSTSAQVQLLIRPSDPLYDVAFAMFAGRKEDRMWQHTLGSVAQHFGSRSEVETEVEVVDRKRQWRQAKNIWHNAAIRSALYTMGAPFRWIGRLFKRSR